ncbi:polyprenyl synthetase family protein [Gorillibacterium sp. sgz500922]|uniref:polyprenyl synthetase family protein n=1 Tax=Gorillibacterium sp. sgz500922 TaxID=3446694 RepID=UPI003F6655E0
MTEQAKAFRDYLQERTAMVEEKLRTVWPPDWEIPPRLRESMDYSLLAGGKRMRPILALGAAEAAGGRTEAALGAACAVELVHTYSLIHDDLPAMDNDDYRRGRLTNHKVYGDAMAILAGDGLLTHAFRLVADSLQEGVPAETCVQIVADLSRLAGPHGMVGGQAADMEGVQGITDVRELQAIHTHKTGDLIVFSLLAGGRCAGAGEQQLDALRIYGYSIGLAFQIQDDILDLTGDEAKLGKPVKSDERQQKVTYPYLIGLEESKRKVEELTEEAKRAIRQAGFPKPQRLLELADYLMNRDH